MLPVVVALRRPGQLACQVCEGHEPLRARLEVLELDMAVGQLVADVVVRPVERLPIPGTADLVEELALVAGGCAANTACVLAKLDDRAPPRGEDAKGDAGAAVQPRPDRRREPGASDGEGAPAENRRQPGLHRAPHRRERHRQRSGGARHPLGVVPPLHADGHHPLWRAHRIPARKRTLRTRKGSLYRGRRAKERQIGSRCRRNSVHG